MKSRKTIDHKYFLNQLGYVFHYIKLLNNFEFCYFFEGIFLNIPNLNRICLSDGSNPLVNAVLEGHQFRAGMFVNMQKDRIVKVYKI